MRIFERIIMIAEPNKMRIFPVIILAVLLAFPGCSSYRDIRIMSCSLESISPTGLKSVDAGFSVDVYNPAREMQITDIEGTVYYGDEEFGHFTAAPVTVPGRATSDVPVELSAALDGSLGIMQLMSMASRFNPDGFTVDVSLKIRIKGGVKKKIGLKGLPVADFFKKVEYESI